MEKAVMFYLCPTCFRVCEEIPEKHNHPMLACIAGQPGDERRKPVADQFGNYVSRAPRWYLEARGVISARSS